jgi:hypothetical protein
MMTTDLEKKFFETFEIEPMLKGYSQVEDNWHGLPMYSGKIKYFNSFEEMNKAGFHSIYDNEENEEDFKEYPQITDRILLELICILCQRDYELGCCWFAISNNVEELKNYLLGDCIEWANDIKQQIQELFKE